MERARRALVTQVENSDLTRRSSLMERDTLNSFSLVETTNASPHRHQLKPFSAPAARGFLPATLLIAPGSRPLHPRFGSFVTGSRGLSTLGGVGGSVGDGDRRDPAARGSPPALPRRTSRSGLQGDRAANCPVLSPFSELRRVSRVPSGRFATPRDRDTAIAEDRPPAQTSHQAMKDPERPGHRDRVGRHSRRPSALGPGSRGR